MYHTHLLSHLIFFLRHLVLITTEDKVLGWVDLCSGLKWMLCVFKYLQMDSSKSEAITT